MWWVCLGKSPKKKAVNKDGWEPRTNLKSYLLPDVRVIISWFSDEGALLIWHIISIAKRVLNKHSPLHSPFFLSLYTLLSEFSDEGLLCSISKLVNPAWYHTLNLVISAHKWWVWERKKEGQCLKGQLSAHSWLSHSHLYNLVISHGLIKPWLSLA